MEIHSQEDIAKAANILAALGVQLKMSLPPGVGFTLLTFSADNPGKLYGFVSSPGEGEVAKAASAAFLAELERNPLPTEPPDQVKGFAT